MGTQKIRREIRRVEDFPHRVIAPGEPLERVHPFHISVFVISRVFGKTRFHPILPPWFPRPPPTFPLWCAACV